jgi:hypothetical protein
MTIYTPPTPFNGPLQTSFVLAPMTARSPVSAFNKYQRVSGPISEFWRVEIDLPGRKADGWRDISAFLMLLRGGVNKARLSDHHRPLRGAGGVSPVVNVEEAAVAGATTLVLNNMLPSEATALKRDDMIGIGENLYTVMFDAPSDADGKCSISILPPLRQGVGEGDAVNLNKPTGLFVLTNGLEALSSSHTGFSAPLTLSFFEDPDLD